MVRVADSNAAQQSALPAQRQDREVNGMACGYWDSMRLIIAVAAILCVGGCRDQPARPLDGARPDTSDHTRTPRDGSAPALPRPLGSDERTIVGQRVSVTLPFHDVANDVAFWADINGQRLLVVTNRDVRDAAQHQRGLPPAHRIDAADVVAPLLVSGTVERLPRAEERYSWSLTSDEAAEVARNGIYLRADTVTAADTASRY
jgi:hypothetical protein